ncbi:MAG: hypothetical protein Q8R02_19100 [Hyphomonadaceae bacterium]|nr:hypothetical protein [Hyphomonadaceae bacterium]
MPRLSLVLPILGITLVAGFVAHGFINRGDYAIAQGAQNDEATAFTDGRPNLVAATFYSAWCSSCAVLEPRLRHILPGFEGRAVEFAKFDFSMGQPESLTEKAKELGVEQVYLANKGATGFMALIDRRNQNVIAIVTVTQSDQDIQRTIGAAIQTASKPAV